MDTKFIILFSSQKQFARIDAGFLSWDFNIEDERGDVLGSVNRNFSGFAREVFDFFCINCNFIIFYLLLFTLY